MSRERESLSSSYNAVVIVPVHHCSSRPTTVKIWAGCQFNNCYLDEGVAKLWLGLTAPSTLFRSIRQTYRPCGTGTFIRCNFTLSRTIAMVTFPYKVNCGVLNLVTWPFMEVPMWWNYEIQFSTLVVQPQCVKLSIADVSYRNWVTINKAIFCRCFTWSWRLDYWLIPWYCIVICIYSAVNEWISVKRVVSCFDTSIIEISFFVLFIVFVV